MAILVMDQHDGLISDSISMKDNNEQSLRLHVENEKGEGGQRNLTVYCPY